MIRVDPSAPFKMGLFEPVETKSSALQSLYVEPEARGAGIEQQLFQQAIRHVRDQGQSEQIVALVGDTTERFRSLVESESFRSEGMFARPGRGMSELYILHLK
jgi:L-amino acid N-acyltransferase YncA